MDIKESILATTHDLVSNFIYYDRKDDEELPRGAIEQAIKDDATLLDDIVNTFRTELMNNI